MITKTLTSLLTNNTSLNLFYAINDTFIANSTIYFSCPLTTLNSLLSLSINSGNISTHKLYVRIALDVSGGLVNNLQFEQNFNLNASNLNNNSFLVNISSITNNLSHDYLCDIMSQTEIFKLYKNYKIIFRVYSGALTNTDAILAQDIVQDLNIVLNTAESGPYDVEYDDVDLVSPFNFTNEERFLIYQKYKSLLGIERVRIFYPKNIFKNSSCPIFIHSHGMGQFTSGYDLYLSMMASYGYFCISMTNFAGPGSGINQIQILDHLNLNINKINNGKFNNLINFNKINFSGHSRGGAAAFNSVLMLQNKNNIPLISNYTISKNNISTLTSFATAHAGSWYENLNFDTGISALHFQESQIKYLNKYIDCPIFWIRGTSDGDSTTQKYLKHYGYCGDIKRNYHDMVSLIPEKYSHGEIAIPPLSSDQYGASRSLALGINTYSIMQQISEETSIYNTMIPTLTQISSELILFLSIQNFTSKKLKKLQHQNLNILDKKIFNQKSKWNLQRTIYNGYDDIKLFVDNFSGITLSFAGNTGATLTPSALGYTYDYAIPYYFKENFGNTLASLVNQGKLFPANQIVGSSQLVSPDSGTNNDAYHGITEVYDKGLYFPIEANRHLGYTFQSVITLNENDYICLRGGLKTFVPRSAGNTLDAWFTVTVIDSSNNTSSVSSKTTNQYFNKPCNVFKYGTASYDDYYSDITTYVDNIYFRAGDFSLINSSLNLSNIKQIRFSFGPDHGSTFAHLVFDEFTIVKEF